MLGAREKAGSFLAFHVGTALAAFCTYFSMYAFRKPFAAGVYDDAVFFGLDLKTIFVLSQLIGYTLSKYLGVKFVSEAQRSRRLSFLLGCIGVAEVALVGFAVVPGPIKALCLLLNGLPLGMVWGLVVRYLEGRRSSELLLSALSCSFIVGSGVVKDVGRWLLTLGVDEYWMPALTGALFIVPFIVSATLLDRSPEPDAQDVELREKREPMRVEARRTFLRDHWPGILLLCAAYLLLTAYRDFRDNYAIEMFVDLGFGSVPALFTRTEVPVAIVVLVLMASLGWFQQRIPGLVSVFVVMGLGLLGIALATVLLERGSLRGDHWMIVVGMGTYLAYVPFSSFLFDRIMAAQRIAGTAVFLVTLSDAVGYTGSVALQLYKDLGRSEVSRLEFFISVSYVLGVVGLATLALAAFYFVRLAVRAGAGGS